MKQLNLEKLLNMQKDLDTRIIKEHGLKGQDLYPNTVLALQVEIAELANEARFFKHWSHDQKPRTSVSLPMKPPLRGMRIVNRVLEEYVDCLHFYLSIAIQKGWQEALYLHPESLISIKKQGLEGGLTASFNAMNYMLLKSYMEVKPVEKIEKEFGESTQQFYFRTAWFLFISIGIVGFEFTLEQIEQAYFDKNKVNHERQSGGY